jgi:hypothetical protein
MTLTNAVQSFPKAQKNQQPVYEYSFTVLNLENKDAQALTAAFIGVPSLQDWDNWLKGWNSCNYYLRSQLKLINVIHSF